MHLRHLVVPIGLLALGCSSESDGGSSEGGTTLLAGSVAVGYYGATHAPSHGVVNRGTILGGASDPEVSTLLTVDAP